MAISNVGNYNLVYRLNGHQFTLANLDRRTALNLVFVLARAWPTGFRLVRLEVRHAR